MILQLTLVVGVLSELIHLSVVLELVEFEWIFCQVANPTTFENLNCNESMVVEKNYLCQF